jgi:hypothetical protein
VVSACRSTRRTKKVRYSRGVTFERYDEGAIITDERGIATFEGGAKVAYFRDPDGNTLSVTQAPRSPECGQTTSRVCEYGVQGSTMLSSA